MKRLAEFFQGIVLAIIAILIATALTSEDADAQRGRPPVAAIDVRPGWTAIALEYTPPPEYEQWWQEIAACEGLPLPEAHLGVQFFAVATREFQVANDPTLTPGEQPSWAIGYAHIWTGQIYLAFPFIADPAIVKHEMLHILQYLANEGVTHSERRYGSKTVGKCGVFPFRRDSVDYR
jgi:hypothetical protein